MAMTVLHYAVMCNILQKLSLQTHVSAGQRKDFMIGIVAHKAREQAADELAGTAGAAFISLDDGQLGGKANHLRVLEWLSEELDDWGIVLEDDAIPCNDWRVNLDQALALSPAPIISLYCGTGFPPQWQSSIRSAISRADETNSPWLVGDHLLHAVGYAIKTELIPDYLSFNSSLPIDQAISRWAQSRRYKVAYTHGSLVDHADGETLVKHPDGVPRNRPRRAHRFGAPLEWSDRSVPLTAGGMIIRSGL